MDKYVWVEVPVDEDNVQLIRKPIEEVMKDMGMVFMDETYFNIRLEEKYIEGYGDAEDDLLNK